MDAEQASLSTIIIDNGNPIGQVIYRCALCRKICDSSSDAMSHYQLDHIELIKMQTQQQPVASNTSLNQNSRNLNSSPHYHSSHQQNVSHNRHQQHTSNSSPSTSSAGSLLKRSSNSNPESLLKRSNNTSPSTSASNSLLKRASNVMRCYQTSTPRSASKRPSTSSVGTAQVTATSKLETPTIHRQYTTTSASRAAKRYSNTTASKNTSNTGLTNTGGNLSTSASSVSTINSASSSSTKARSTTPRHIQRTNQYAADLKAKIIANKAANTPVSTQKSASSSSQMSSTSTDINSSASAPGNESTTPNSKDSLKTYSLRPRSLNRRSVRIS